MKNVKTISALALAAALTACGGGDDSSTNASAEGFWNDDTASILVTGTGELWGIEATNSSLILYKGNLTTSGTNFTAQLAAYSGNQKINATANGTVVPGQTLQGTVSAAGYTPSNFSMTYGSTYNQTPNATALAGEYKDTGGEIISIAANGTFSTVNAQGCPQSGTITPDQSGKNFYRMVLNIGQDATCGSLAGQTGTGVVAVAGTNYLVGGVVLGSLGEAFLLTKQ